MAIHFSILAIAYLLGSIPTGFLVGKYLKDIDIRTIGSGSTGATNVLRNLGKWPALFVFIIDVTKGIVAVKLAQFYINQSIIEVLSGLLAISGHIWPIWLKGKGGKAVATGLGMFISLSWQVGFASLGVFLTLLTRFKIVSLSSIFAAICLPILMYLNLGIVNHPFTIVSLVVSILVIWKHRTNIKRLLEGSEPKINSK